MEFLKLLDVYILTANPYLEFITNISLFAGSMWALKKWNSNRKFEEIKTI